MNRLYSISNHLVNEVTSDFSRFIFNQISSEKRLNGIIGARGTGKTTLLLQMMKGDLKHEEKSLYISLDDPCFSNVSLYNFSLDFYRKGGISLYIDNLHKKEHCAKDIWSLHNECPSLKITFSSSLRPEKSLDWEMIEEEADIHPIAGLSFREFLELKHQLPFPLIRFDELIELNRNPGAPVLNRIRPLQYFDEYLKGGYYPFAAKAGININRKIVEQLNQVLEGDLSAQHNLDYDSLNKIRKLLVMLAETGPVKPNVESLAKDIGTTRDSLLKFLSYLQNAGLVNKLHRINKKGDLLKPKRIYLNNSNLVHALSMEAPNPEDLYETFLINQLKVDHKLDINEGGYIIVDNEYHFSMDWKNPRLRRQGNEPGAYSISEGIEYQAGTNIPLWMFGFLY